MPASLGAGRLRRVGVDKVMFGYVDAVEGVLVGLKQAAGVGRRAQQVGALAQGSVVFGRDQDGIAVLGDDLDGVVVFVDPLDQREEFFACLARGDRHDGQPSGSGTGYCTISRAVSIRHSGAWAGYRLGSDRGSPNHGSTLLSKRVIAQIRSPESVSTKKPVPWRMPRGARR